MTWGTKGKMLSMEVKLFNERQNGMEYLHSNRLADSLAFFSLLGGI